MLQELLCYTFITCLSCVTNGCWYVSGGDYPVPTCINFMDITGTPIFSAGGRDVTLCPKTRTTPPTSPLLYSWASSSPSPISTSSSSPTSSSLPPSSPSPTSSTLPPTIFADYLVKQAKSEIAALSTEFETLMGISIFSLVSTVMCWFFGEDLNALRARIRSYFRRLLRTASQPPPVQPSPVLPSPSPPNPPTRPQRNSRGRAPSLDPQRIMAAQEEMESRMENVMRIVGQSEGIEGTPVAGSSSSNRENLDDGSGSSSNSGDDADVEAGGDRSRRSGSVLSLVGFGGDSHRQGERSGREGSVLGHDGSGADRTRRSASVLSFFGIGGDDRLQEDREQSGKLGNVFSDDESSSGEVERGSRAGSVIRFFGFGGDEEEGGNNNLVHLGATEQGQQQTKIGFFRRLATRLEKAMGASKPPQIYQMSYHRESPPDISEYEEDSFHRIQKV